MISFVLAALALSLPAVTLADTPVLVPLQSRFGGSFTGGVLDGVRSLAISGDGDYVYTASEYDHAVAVFSRDGGNGDLTFLQVWHDGDDLVDGLRHANTVVLSPDGANAYVSGFLDHAVATFDRNAVSGELTFVQVVKDGEGGADGLRGAHRMTVSDDGKHVYVAAYYESAIGIFDRDLVTGELTFNDVVRDGEGGVDGIDGVLWVALSPDGSHLYAAGAADHSVAVFSRDAGTGALTFVEAQKDGVGGVNGMGGARVCIVSPDGEHVYVGSGGILIGTIDNAVAVFDRDTVTGALTFVTAYFDGVGGITALEAPYDLAMTSDGTHLYVAGFEDDSVVAFSRDAITGTLAMVDQERDGTGGVQHLLGAHAVAVSPGDEHVYAGAFHDDAVVIFARDGGGELTLADEEVEGQAVTSRVEAVAVAPDGQHVYTAGFAAAAVSMFPRNPTSGFLGLQTSVTVSPALTGASGVAVSPDGEHVYATGMNGDALVGFDRDVGTGLLTSIQTEIDGAGGVDGLGGARAVVVSPDGNHVYVAGEGDDAVAVFARDAGSGLLTFVEAQIDGAGADGLDGVHALALSADGENLYAAGKAEDAVAVFSRDAGTGALTFVEVHRDGIAGVDGIDGAAAVAVSGDGGQVYVAGASEAAVAVFSRNPVGGALTFSAVHKNGIDGVAGLAGATGLSLTGDGAYLFVASAGDDALAMFARDVGTGALTFGTAEFDNIGAISALRGSFAVATAASGAEVYVVAPDDNAISLFALNLLCANQPRTDCRQAPEGKLIISDNPNDEKDRVVYQWLYGVETLPQVLGNPASGSTHYSMCVYDDNGGSPNFLFSLVMPRGGVCKANGKACWRFYFGDYFYRDPERTPDGVKFMRLHWGRQGDPNVAVRAKGVNVPDLPALPLTPPVTVQVNNTDGECWSTQFASDEVKKNAILPSGRALFRAVDPP